MRLPLFSENTLFATINIIHSRGLHSSTTALQQGGAQDTDSVAVVARCSGRWGGKEPSQGDSCGTEDFHPCNPRHQSSWAHWAQALGTARLRHTRLVVMGTFSRDTRCSTASQQVTGPLGGSGAGNIICNSHWNIVLVCYSHTNSNSTSIIIHQQILTSLTL